MPWKSPNGSRWVQTSQHPHAPATPRMRHGTTPLSRTSHTLALTIAPTHRMRGGCVEDAWVPSWKMPGGKGAACMELPSQKLLGDGARQDSYEWRLAARITEIRTRHSMKASAEIVLPCADKRSRSQKYYGVACKITTSLQYSCRRTAIQ